MSQNSGENSYFTQENNLEKVMHNVAVILIVRNEEKFLGKAIQSVMEQDLKPYRIIAINDGSTDNTKQVLLKFPTVEIVDRPVRKESHLAKKELAMTINDGLVKLHNDSMCEYVWLTGGDLVFPQDYVKQIINRMQRDSVIISSGVIQGEYSTEPRGGGRIVDWGFWKKLGMLYPPNYGWEGYLVFKAKSMGYNTKSYSDIVFTAQRKTGMNIDPKRYYYYGLAFKALGYTLPYILANALFFSKKRSTAAVWILRGYFSNYDNLYEKELRNYVRRTQLSNMFSVATLKQFFKRI